MITILLHIVTIYLIVYMNPNLIFYYSRVLSSLENCHLLFTFFKVPFFFIVLSIAYRGCTLFLWVVFSKVLLILISLLFVIIHFYILHVILFIVVWAIVILRTYENIVILIVLLFGFLVVSDLSPCFLFLFIYMFFYWELKWDQLISQPIFSILCRA